MGSDERGERGIAALESHEIDCRHVQRDPRHPTGTVTVSRGAAGDASYVFASDTAWDDLAWEPSLGELAARASGVCFGTLGQRAEESRRTIRRFLAAAACSAAGRSRRCMITPRGRAAFVCGHRGATPRIPAELRA